MKSARRSRTRSHEILMACSFQDITGQRTTKVVNTLRYLEQRVNAMIEIWGIESMDGAKPPLHAAPPDDQRPDSHLLNGPALEGGVSQDDVDALLAGLEPALADSDPKTANANDKPPRKEVAAKSTRAASTSHPRLRSCSDVGIGIAGRDRRVVRLIPSLIGR